jgi:hypothetical protein
VPKNVMGKVPIVGRNNRKKPLDPEITQGSTFFSYGKHSLCCDMRFVFFTLPKLAQLGPNVK